MPCVRCAAAQCMHKSSIKSDPFGKKLLPNVYDSACAFIALHHGLYVTHTHTHSLVHIAHSSKSLAHVCRMQTKCTPEPFVVKLIFIEFIGSDLCFSSHRRIDSNAQIKRSKLVGLTLLLISQSTCTASCIASHFSEPDKWVFCLVCKCVCCA